MNRSVEVTDGSIVNPIASSAVLRDDHAQLDRLVITLHNIQHSSDESLNISQQAVGSLNMVNILAYVVTALDEESYNHLYMMQWCGWCVLIVCGCELMPVPFYVCRFHTIQTLGS